MPLGLFLGLRAVIETSLGNLNPFYASMVHSYAHVNDLFYQRNKNLPLPVNLWGHPKSQHIDKVMAESGFLVVNDLPLSGDKIDFRRVQEQLPAGLKSTFLTCYKLQSVFRKFFQNSVPSSETISDELVLQSKALLMESGTEMLSLSKWERFFQMMPLSKVECEMVFMCMIAKYKYTKFWEINFKILARILLTLKMLACICKNLGLMKCPWCKTEGSLEHYLFACTYVQDLQCKVVQDNMALFGDWSDYVWCFGALKNKLNPILWVINFAIYKGYLRALEGYHDDLFTMVAGECAQHEYLFPILSDICWNND